jgi:hypothetical protein
MEPSYFKFNPFLYILVLLFITESQQAASSSSWLRYGTPRCIQNCIEKHSDAFFCTYGREDGYCCQDDSRSECRDNYKEDVFCSQGAKFHNVMVYS